MGAGFPLLQQAVQTDLSRIGRRIGTLLLANIIGSAIGTFVTGWFALGWLGTVGTLKALLLLSAIFPVFGMTVLWRHQGRRDTLILGAAVAIIVTLVIVLPDAEVLWERLHGAAPHSIVHGEDGSGMSVLKVEPSGFQAGR